MKTWRVTGTVVASTYVGDVKAETKEEAEAKAWDMVDVSVCHQCDRYVSDPEVSELHLEEVDEEE